MYRFIWILFLAIMPLFAYAQEEEYVEYVTKHKETIFSISRATGVKVNKILELNPGFTRTTKLKLGQIIKLPANSKVVEVQPSSTDYYVATPYDPLKRAKIPAQFVGDTLSGNKSGADDKVVMAFLLPLYAKESGFSEEEGITSDRKIPAKAEQFMQFYEGALLALDSLKRSGMSVEYQIFDVGRGTELLAGYMDEINALNPDVIIGPVYEAQAKLLCDSLHNKSIPVVYPLSNRAGTLTGYENLLMVNISERNLAVEMATWLQGCMARESANVLCFNLGGIQRNIESYLSQSVTAIPGVVQYNWNRDIVADSNATLMKPLLRQGVENYIVVPVEDEASLSRVLPIFMLCKDEFNITVVGLPDWQTYNRLDLESYYKLNVTMLTYSYTDGASDSMKSFTNNFVKYFGDIPSNLACKGYDSALFFGNLAYKTGRGEGSEVLGGGSEEGLFSVFRFVPMDGGAIKENRALYSVTYGRDYRLKIYRIN